jgi:8-oxo-dGTP diphosphatase
VSHEPASPEPLPCAGALILDDDGRIFVQLRSATRTLFPNCWDIVGGHLEPGESYDDALRREVEEETGWQVSVVLGPVGEIRYRGDDGLDRVERDYLVRVDGDLRRPRLETEKVTECRWLDEAEIEVLGEPKDKMIYDLVAAGFDVARTFGLR